MELIKIINRFILAVLVCFAISCNTRSNEKFSGIYFRDYNLFLRKGIEPLNNSDVEQLRRGHQPFFKIILKNNNIDSIIIFNPYLNKKPMRISVLTNDSVQVFTTAYPYHSNDSVMLKTYFRFTHHSAVQYVFFERDEVCQRTTLLKDRGMGISFVYDPRDTNNFQRKLLGIGGLKVASKINSKTLNKGLSQDLTFLHWLSYKKINR